MKKNSEKGITPVIKMKCGRSKGCEVPYITPHGGTKEDLQRHNKEDMKDYPPRKLAA